MSNECLGCIERNGNDCCVNVYIILNPDEIILFNKHTNEFVELKNGGIFYTTRGCPYFLDNHCQIHSRKPLYCKYYPIFITGKPFIHEECSINSNYTLSEEIKQEINEIQQIYPIYQQDWFWEDVKRKFQDKNSGI